MVSETTPMVLGKGLHTMALDRSLLLELLEVLKGADVEERIRGHRQLVEPVRRYGHGWGRPGRVPRSVSGHCGRGRASDLVPDDESLGHCAAVLGGGEPVTAGAEVRGDTTEGGQEPLGMTR